MIFIRPNPRPIASLLFALVLACAGGPAVAGTATGTATYRERMALPLTAEFEASIEDVSRADAPSVVIATTQLELPKVPVAFSLGYDDARIESGHRYVVSARITVNGAPLIATDTAYPVLGADGAHHVDLLLRRVDGTATAAAPLENTTWKLVRLHGAAAARPQHEPTIVLNAADKRVSGTAGCNRLVGGYTLAGEHLSFSQMAGSMMMCMQDTEQERAFLQTLSVVRAWRMSGRQLDLLDDHGAVLAQFEARTTP